MDAANATEAPNSVSVSPSIKNLLKLALPIAAGMISLSLLSLIETMILGNYDPIALAASAAANYVFFIFLSCFAGFAIAVQTQVASFYQHDNQQTQTALHSGIFQILSCAALIVLGVQLFSDEIIRIQVSEASLIAPGAEYLEIKTWSVLPIALIMALRGFWHGSNQPKVFLIFITFAHTLAAVLSYLLVNGAWGLPELGLNGAAYSSVISLACGALGLGLFSRQQLKNLLRVATVKNALFRHTWQLAWPTSLQQTIFAFGTAAFMAFIGRLGVTDLAAAHILITLSLVLILPVIGIGMATTTFVSQHVGELAKHQQSSNTTSQLLNRWFWLAQALSGGLVLLVGLLVCVFAEGILSGFTQEQAVIDAGYWAMIILAPSLFFEAATIISKQSLYGIRKNRQVMKVLVITQWLILLPVMLFIHFNNLGSLEIYTLMHAGQRLINCIWLYQIWRKHLNSID